MRSAILAALTMSVVVGLTVPGDSSADARTTTAEGLGHPTNAAVRLDVIQYNPPGRDTGTNKSRNAEWVQICNFAATAARITGWRLHDSIGARHRYTFPATTLGNDRCLRVHSGRGTNDPRNRYWGLRSYVWNNDGDTAVLVDRAGSEVDRCGWIDPLQELSRKYC